MSLVLGALVYLLYNFYNGNAVRMINFILIPAFAGMPKDF
ncbi:hypothetical protein CLOAM1818 [Candidatus Cloacimonas acidaminovorans str. Evry]|uniref:Uncharacterized protein n=1 Tax=Cloacimonas acidaminovorans (strain Evry) TaxID=459349 RepID=B0VJI9_CLOAI|nr:hypothetical protein CLOAM1818 [Candidatus Cloacimonas acidaminovorans str. Evry]